LQKQSFTVHLLNGHKSISAKINMQRQDSYADYVKLFGTAKIQEWRARIVPPSPTLTQQMKSD
jgi:hypothetical protein